MISFEWNRVKFNITNIGGGILDEDIPRHAHSKDSYELHFITGGKGELITDEKAYTLSPEDVFITGPNFYHSQTADKSNPVEDVFIMLQAINDERANAISSEFLKTHFYYSSGFGNSVAKEILSEFRNKKADYKSAIIGLTIKLMTDITRLLLPSSYNESIFEESLYDMRFVIIEKAFLYNPNLTLRELSNEIGVCERHTQRLLKRYYGKSFREKKKESRQSRK